MNFYKPTKPDNKNHIFKYTLLTSSQRMSFHNFYNLPTVARGPPDKIFSHKQMQFLSNLLHNYRSNRAAFFALENPQNCSIFRSFLLFLCVFVCECSSVHKCVFAWFNHIWFIFSEKKIVGSIQVQVDSIIHMICTWIWFQTPFQRQSATVLAVCIQQQHQLLILLYSYQTKLIRFEIFN